MARIKKNDADLPDEEPLDDDLDMIHEEEEDDTEEDKGIDEILGDATLGRAGSDLDGWGGGEDYES
ncbi:MAG: hypothetical protein IKR75_06955 [Fibrobacter sp.]|jgi:hypothetical protein|uniref:hypothetical protein n=1 Tax=uncultured Fibrobacter sp. TaxID=261512 RepID=UPI0015662A33|nr:hypothetical protein [uncultured Fibrobacter sp.]MBQ1823592.1 hypothetical protein [Fibrobacter sp.]MBR6318146.1 hypothetical protein [Fibrobacter sp.]